MNRETSRKFVHALFATAGFRRRATLNSPVGSGRAGRCGADWTASPYDRLIRARPSVVAIPASHRLLGKDQRIEHQRTLAALEQHVLIEIDFLDLWPRL